MGKRKYSYTAIYLDGSRKTQYILADSKQKAIEHFSTNVTFKVLKSSFKRVD